MNKHLFFIGALFGLLAVAIGAFGAHGLTDKITPHRIATFKTGVNYQFYHTFAIFIAVGLATYFKKKIFLRAAWFFVMGILFFSGSLYLLATQTYLGIESFAKIIGPITPIGGLLFIIGWGLLAVGAKQISDNG
ncbi:MAG TPA: DUF423 domain-containing protein [Phaeodactylibacter sp.]|nr:DUF423 domain-containing protein [Phaeodactylibacter sp.]